MTDTVDTLVGIAIRERREALGISQAVLASALKLSRTSVTNIERGRQPMSISHLYLAAEMLGTSPRDLLPDNPYPREPRRGRDEANVPALLRKLMPEAAGSAE